MINFLLEHPIIAAFVCLLGALAGYALTLLVLIVLDFISKRLRRRS